MAEILHKDLVGEDIHELRVTLGSGSPSTVPLFVGQGYYDLVNKKLYVAQGTTLVSDWLTTDIPPFLNFLDTATIAWTATTLGNEISYTADVQEANLVLTSANITDFGNAVLTLPQVVSLLADQHTGLILRTGGEVNPGVWSPQSFNGLELDSDAQKVKLTQNLSTSGDPTFNEITLTIQSKTPLLTLTAGGAATAASMFLDTAKGMVSRGSAGSTSSFTLENEAGTDVLSNPVSTNQLIAPSLGGIDAPYVVHSDANGLLSASKLVDADVAAAAAIAGTKIAPDFGSQNITTTGSVLVDTIESNTNDIGILTGNDNKNISIGTGSGYNTINIGGVNTTVNIQGATYTTPIEYVSEDKNIVVNFNASGQDSPDSGLYVQEEYDGALINLTDAAWQSGNTVRYAVDMAGIDGLVAGEYVRITGFTNSENNGTFKVLVANSGYIDVVNPKRTDASKDETTAATAARLLLNGYIHVGSTRMSWEVKAPAHAGIIELKPQSAAKTLLITSESANNVTVKFNTDLTVDQDLQKTSSVEFANVKVSSFTTGIVHSDSSGNLSSSLIQNVDVDGAAAIAGTKIVPDFGSQDIATTGDATVGTIKVTDSEPIGGANISSSATDGLVLRGIAGTSSQFKFIGSLGANLVTISDTSVTLHSLTSGVVKAVSGVLSSSALVDADVSATAAIAGTKISPDFGAQNITTTGSATVNSAKISGFTTGIVHSDTDGDLTSSTIVNADVDAAAAIAGTKISPNFGSQNIQTTGTVTATGVTVAGFATGIVHSDSSGNFTSSTIVNADVDAAAAIAGTKISPNFGSQNIQTTGSATVNSATISGLSTGIVHSDGSGNLTSSSIVDADVSATAAIAGTKISPNFGSQNIQTTGSVTAGSAKFSGLNTVGVVHNDAAGNLSTSLIVNADISATAAIADTKLATISTAGKVLNSATTATSSNTASAIVARDVNGDFVARKIQATDILATSNALNLGTSADTVTVLGDFVVQGNTVTLNTATLNVEDKNITLNKGGTTAAAAGAGLTVEGTGATAIAGLLYDSALASKFKLGATGSESEVITTTGAQQINDKTATNLTVSNYEDLQTVAASATPASNYVRFYAKTDGKLYLKASDGVEFLIRTGADPYTPTTSAIEDYHFEATSLNGTAVFSNAETTLNFDFWSSTGPLNTARWEFAGAGTQNAALAFGGDTSGGRTAVTEKFNGSLWSTTGSLSAAKHSLGGVGTQNAALAFGGNTGASTAVTEKFNGSTWTSTGSLSAANGSMGCAGVQNAALSFGGYPDTGYTALTEKFNGSIWATNAAWNLSAAKYGLVGVGTQNAALALGGYSNNYTTVIEKFNGNAWTTAGNLLAGKYFMASAGTQNAALTFGGDSLGAPVSTVEKFNGKSSALSQNLAVARNNLAGAGTQNAALAFGGYGTDFLAVTEKFHGQLQHGFAGVFKGSTNTLNINSTDSAITMNLGSEAGILQLDVAFNINGGLSSQEKLWITELEREDYQSGEWSANSYLSAARSSLGGAGTQNAALAFGGFTTVATGLTEKLNGTAWSTTGSLGTARYELAGTGTQNAALAFGGTTSALTEKFNGTAWSTTGSLGTAKGLLAGIGTQNAALAFGGLTASLTVTPVTEKFNGSTWSTTGSLGLARYALGGSGTQNAALAFGGNTGSASAVVEKFNGSTWSTTGSLGTANRFLAGTGTQNAALAFGGFTTVALAVSEKFNGNTWGATGSLGLARYRLAGAGTQNAALAFGGTTGTVSALTEKFNYNLQVIPRTIGNGTWSSSGALSVARYDLAGAGTQNAGLAFGGYGTNYSSTTEKFNGTSWTTVASSLLTARTGLAGAGTQNAALAFGGEVSGGSASQLTQAFNGTVWSSTGNISVAKVYLAGAGTQYAGLAFGGGIVGGVSNTAEKFNGSTWATVTPATLTARYYLAGTGTQNAALAMGGVDSLSNYVATVEKFNGSTWSATASLSTVNSGPAASGTQNAALIFGGTDGLGVLSTAQKFNGYAWTTTSSISIARSDLGGLGSQNNGLVFGGGTGGTLTPSAVTEKYNEISVNSLQIN